MPDWKEILGREGPAVWQTAYRILGNHADAEECFQETFLAALQVSRREPVQCWPALLRRLATARTVEVLRRRRRSGRRQETADLDTFCAASPSPCTAEEKELAQCLREALARLPPKQAEVFCLHCLEGWSYQEIARHLAISTTAAGVLLHRARQRLRKLLAATCF
jgi:RNA polymerase sigma-70 factor (ECF subfamily)